MRPNKHYQFQTTEIGGTIGNETADVRFNGNQISPPIGFGAV